MKKCFKIAIGAALFMTILVCGCSDPYKGTNGVDDAAIRVKLDTTTVSLPTGGSKIITATIEPSTVTNKAVTWASSNPAVATVNDAGVVIAVGAGNATITAKSALDTTKAASCAVSVGTVGVFMSMVELNKYRMGLKVGDSETLIAAVSVIPGVNRALTWTSSNPDVATVNDTGLVSALAEGTTLIQATLAEDSYGFQLSAGCRVTVPEIPTVTGISLDKTTLELFIDYSNGGYTLQSQETLNVTIEPWGAYYDVIWSSSNPSVVTVSEWGELTPIANGIATVTVQSVEDNSKSATCEITVVIIGTPFDMPTGGDPGMDY